MRHRSKRDSLGLGQLGRTESPGPVEEDSFAINRDGRLDNAFQLCTAHAGANPLDGNGIELHVAALVCIKVDPDVHVAACGNWIGS